MPFGLLAVQQTIDGISKPRTTYWPVKELRSGSSNQPIDQPFIDRLFGGPLLANSSLDFYIPTVPASTGMSPVQRILRFHDSLQGTNVRLTKVTLSDGVTPGPGQGPFKTIDLNRRCSNVGNGGGTLDFASVAPANVALLMNLSPFEPGVHTGHKWLRCCVPKSFIRPRDDDGVEFVDEAALNSANTTVQNILLVSGVRQLFAGIPIGAFTHRTGIGQFATKADIAANPANKGLLKAVRDATAMNLKEAASRQTTRGRKRPLTAAQIAKELQVRGVTFNLSELQTSFAPPATLDTGISLTYPDNADAPVATLNLAVYDTDKDGVISVDESEEMP